MTQEEVLTADGVNLVRKVVKKGKIAVYRGGE